MEEIKKGKQQHLSWNLQTKNEKEDKINQAQNKSNGGMKIYGDLRTVSRTRQLNIKAAERKLLLNTRS